MTTIVAKYDNKFFVLCIIYVDTFPFIFNGKYDFLTFEITPVRIRVQKIFFLLNRNSFGGEGGREIKFLKRINERKIYLELYLTTLIEVYIIYI